MEEIGVGESRFGGIPDLPQKRTGKDWMGTPWPASEAGPMCFLCQLDLTRLSSFKSCAELPKTGSLLFFWGSPTPASVEDSLRVIYTDETNLHRPVDDWELPDTRAYRACKLSFIEDLKLPHTGSKVVKSMGMSDKELDLYAKLYRWWRYNMRAPKGFEPGNSWIMGYPDKFNTPESADWQPPLEIASIREDRPLWRLLLQNDAGGRRTSKLFCC
jgi:hypothetical protein